MCYKLETLKCDGGYKMDVITMARELGKIIQQDERYHRIDAAKKANDEDQELQGLIESFNMKRTELSQEMSKDTKDQEKLTVLDKELKEVYAKVMGNPNMAEFNEAKTGIDSMMNFITEILYASVNGDDPDTVEEHAEGCSGNCGSCGGSCH